MAKANKIKEKNKEKESQHKQETQGKQEPDAVKGEEEEEEAARRFEELGLDPRLIRALNKKENSITDPTPIQRVAIPLILVMNYDMPLSVTGCLHRIGRTGRAYSTGATVSLVSPDEMEILEEIKSFLGDDENNESDIISPYPLLTKNAVESLWLKAHFELNPKDLDHLKHDKVLSKKPPAPHLSDVPDYLLDATTKEASKMVKLARAAMGTNNSARHPGPKRKFRKSRDPLKSFYAEGPRRGRKGGMKRGGKDGDDTHKHKKKNFSKNSFRP